MAHFALRGVFCFAGLAGVMFGSVSGMMRGFSRGCVPISGETRRAFL